MDYSITSNHKNLIFSPAAVNSKRLSVGNLLSPSRLRSRKVLTLVSAAGASRCDPGSSLNAPLEPRSSEGKLLSRVLLNQRQFFHFAAAGELKRLADDRDAAVSRMLNSSGSDEACLHRRIAELKELDCRTAVEDVMFMLIFYKFSEVRVPMVPKLSQCMYNDRLEILPSKDYELESIHTLEILKLVRDHVTAVTGLRSNSSVKDTWATTKIDRLCLNRVYAASILYGYFLKSASTRHRLEQCLDRKPLQLNNTVLGLNPTEELTCYILGFDPETLKICAKPKSKEAMDLIEKHSRALFGDENENSRDNVILTSFSSLKRLVLEAVAFGCFLWDSEEFVDNVYKLNQNTTHQEG